MRVIVTRNEELAQPYIDAVTALGGEAVPQPLYHYRDLDAVLPDLSSYRALTFTSAQGVRRFAAVSPLRDMPVYAVGPQTGDEARRQGFTTIYHAAGTGGDLARLLKPEDAPYLYGRAREISFPLAEAARERGMQADEVILYETVPVGDFSWGIGADMVLFFSARAARIFAELAENKGFSGALGRTKALCLGAGMVEFLSPLRWREICVCASPDRAGMIELLKKEWE